MRVKEQIQDYYSFGSPMPGRQYNSSSARYGYQGSEKDDEINGTARTYSTFYRELSCDIGRWWSIDPKARPWESPYVSMANNPIWHTDFKGDSISATFRKGGEKETYTERAFKEFLGTKEGYEYLSKFAAKGQTLYGVTFKEDGEYHKKGVDLNYGELSFTSEDVLTGRVYSAKRGEFSSKTVDGRLKMDVKINYFLRDNLTDEFQKDYNDALQSGDIKKMDNVLLLQRVQTFTHETFIHGDYAVKDFLHIPYKKYTSIVYGTDHWTEHMRTENIEKTQFNTQGYQLMQRLNEKQKTGWDGNRIWYNMMDFQY